MQAFLSGIGGVGPYFLWSKFLINTTLSFNPACIELVDLLKRFQTKGWLRPSTYPDGVVELGKVLHFSGDCGDRTGILGVGMVRERARGGRHLSRLHVVHDGGEYIRTKIW